MGRIVTVFAWRDCLRYNFVNSDIDGIAQNPYNKQRIHSLYCLKKSGYKNRGASAYVSEEIAAGRKQLYAAANETAAGQGGADAESRQETGGYRLRYYRKKEVR